ncbi:MAG: DoxX family protein [Acidimicrobiales bacterium]
MAPKLPRGPRLVATAFSISGLVHLFAPRVFERIVPRWLPRHRQVVYVSGLAELACAGGLVTRRSWAGPASASVLLAVWPANIQMAVDDTRAGRPWWRQALLWGRVPLQLPLIRFALQAPR